MTLTELAKKHNLEPDRAMAFLREWLDAQPVVAYKDEQGPLMGANIKPWPTDTPLIARPTLGE